LILNIDLWLTLFLIGLDNRYLSTLACQAMFVQRIPKDLETLITRKSDKFVSISIDCYLK
jgi:hypothetical protein